MPFKFGLPATNRFSKEEHLGHVLVFVEPHETQESTSFGDSSAATCEYVACVTCGTVTSDAKLFGSALVPAIVGSGEPLVLGVLEQGEAKPGRSAPWLLGVPTDVDESVAEAFMADNFSYGDRGQLLYVEKPF